MTRLRPRPATRVLESDFRRAEYTAIPITLILLVLVFGALIAAGIPVVLAGSCRRRDDLAADPVSRFLPIGAARRRWC